MSESGTTSATDELRKRWEASKPSKSELEKARYSIDEYRPMNPDSKGWPAMRKLKILFILGITYIGFWVWYMMRVAERVISPNSYVDAFGFLIVIGLSSLALGVMWKLNEGCFSDFRIILEPFLVVKNGKLCRSMLRIKRITQIYPLAPEIVITAEDLEGALSRPKPPGPERTEPPTPKKDPDDRSEGAKKHNPTGSTLRPSSIEEMVELFQDILHEDPTPFKDNVVTGVELERRFVDLVKSVNLDMFVNLAETPDFPAIFLTDYPVESPSGEAKAIQFGFHDFFQKTYIWDKKNSNSSSWGICVHIDDFRFHVWNSGKKKYELKFAPIFYVAFSDGNLDDLLTQLFPRDRKEQKKRRPIEDAKTLAQGAKDAYTATLAEELIIRDKMHTGIIDAKDKEIEVLERQNTKGAKKIVARGLRWMVLAGESMDESGLDKLKAIFSKGAIKWIVYLIFGIFVFMGFLLLLQVLTGIQFYTLPSGGGGGGVPGGNPEPYTPGSLIIGLLRSVNIF